MRILSEVKAGNVKQLNLFLLTDGGDGNRSKTTEIANMLKHELRSRDIPSKFCVLGIGRGADAIFLDELSKVGNE